MQLTTSIYVYICIKFATQNASGVAFSIIITFNKLV